MMHQRNIEKEVDRALELLDNWERGTAGEDFWTKVQGKVKQGAAGRSRFLFQPTLQLAILAILFAVNVSFGVMMESYFTGNGRTGTGAEMDAKADTEMEIESSAETEKEAESLEDFKEEYGLTEESYDLDF